MILTVVALRTSGTVCHKEIRGTLRGKGYPEVMFSVGKVGIIKKLIRART